MASKLTNVMKQVVGSGMKSVATPTNKLVVQDTNRRTDTPSGNSAVPVVRSSPNVNQYNSADTNYQKQIDTQALQNQPVMQQYQPSAMPDVTAQRQAMVALARQRLLALGTQQKSDISTNAENLKRDINSRYLQGNAGELEGLVNQGLASGLGGAEQSGQARSEILQRQLSSENQANAVDVQKANDISAIDRQYNDLIAQGDIESAQQMINDIQSKYQNDLNNYQYGIQLNQQTAQNAQEQKNFEAQRADAQAATNYQREQDAIRLAYDREQQAIDNAFNNKQLTQKQAEEKRRILEADRDYKLNAAQVNYQIGKPYYSPKKTGGSNDKEIDLSAFGIK